MRGCRGQSPPTYTENRVSLALASEGAARSRFLPSSPLPSPLRHLSNSDTRAIGYCTEKLTHSSFRESVLPTKLPRLNVTVTPEQHALLLELAELNGRSAASYLRDMVDRITPTLRAVVPMMREAARETEISREHAQGMIDDVLQAIRDAGLSTQPDLLDGSSRDGAKPPERNVASGSERGRTARRARRG